jgi:hypothetical protein
MEFRVIAESSAAYLAALRGTAVDRRVIEGSIRRHSGLMFLLPALLLPSSHAGASLPLQ